MAPGTQYVFAETLGISEHFTAGSHEWLPYSVFSTFPKQTYKHQFSVLLRSSDNQIVNFYILHQIVFANWGRLCYNCSVKKYHPQCGLKGGPKWKP